MDEATEAKYRDLKQRVGSMRRFAKDKPHLAGTINEQAERLEAEADALRRKYPELDHDRASPGD